VIIDLNKAAKVLKVDEKKGLNLFIEKAFAFSKTPLYSRRFLLMQNGIFFYEFLNIITITKRFNALQFTPS